ncbi:HAD family hydrolase [Halalkalibacter hemicellulosilyticus]|uniref:Phosphoglycolate phosphatase n=1 Tax=Halalkalibacter hemicellulosilyticusJCM 9152 TaxID=1236971 RepID=W4QIB5_9BACI|nr:HAD-IA family hydrolase [Halalkalibacter hemicellulosilyticus]GAE31836.1 phosphoglycolate phosphatase [Halalkalibacter hemicellulosilyticusJCM 9152]
MVKVLIFDFDGLVFDTETYDLEAFQELYKKYKVDFPLEEWMNSIGSSLKFDPYEHLLVSCPEISRDDIRLERSNLYQELLEGKSPREGVEDYLKRAKQLGIKIALASSSTRSWIDYHMNKLGIISYFDYICTSDDVEKVKPEPDLYKKILRYFEISPKEAVVFEDSPNGSLASIRAEIPCVIVPNETTKFLKFDERVALCLNSKVDMTLDRILEVLSLNNTYVK